MKQHLLALFFVFTVITPQEALPQPASLVKDITTSTPSRPESLTLTGGEVFFVADDGIHGRDLWASDGTGEGTRLVKDLRPGRADPAAGNLIRVNDRLFFTAGDGTSSSDLWVSDGSEAGTHIVREFNPGAWGTYGYAEVNGELYFSLTLFDGRSWKSQIWRSDGTPEGTILVKEIGRFPPAHLTDVDGTLFFMVSTELWKSDGTPEGTVLVAEPYSGPNPPTLFWLAGMGGRLFLYYASTGLWTSDGTAEGTVLLKDTGPGAGHGSWTVANGKLFFATHCLWTSDGTSEGTVSLVDSDACRLYPDHLTTMDGKVFFEAHDPEHGYELWVSDGTPGGTLRVMDIHPGPLDSYPESLTVWNGKLYFTADDGTHGRELWTSDGTPEGTSMVQDLVPGLRGSWIEGLTAAEEALFFSHDDGVHGTELWSTDGTPGGASIVRDINVSGTSSSRISVLTAFDGNLFCQIHIPGPPWSGSSSVLWRTDGSEEGTVPVTELLGSGYSTFIEAVNGRLVFYKYDAGTGMELWISDGTPEGTELLKDLAAGSPSSFPECDAAYCVAAASLLKDSLFFATNNGIYVTDGTSAGTVPFRDLIGLPEGLFPWLPIELDGRLFFTVWDESTGGGDLWASDGTPQGTGIFLDLDPTEYLSRPLVSVGGKLFFHTCSSSGGTRLWASDGTSEGTLVLLEESWCYDVGGFTQVAGEVFFVGFFLGLSGIWRTDGTPEGTWLFREFNWVSGLTTWGGNLLFFAEEADTGREPWLSDGTEAGTTLLKDVHPGPGSSVEPYSPVFTSYEGKLLFAADDGSSGAEFWQSDGTAEGTFLLQDINPGAASSSPSGFTVAGRTVYFTADDGTHGRELWNLPLGERSRFHRGDTNSSGTTDISDGISVFGYLFLGAPAALSCVESADSNNDGRIDISDGIHLLNWLFTGGPEPPSPGSTGRACGFDPDPTGSRGDLGCNEYAPCR
jgi:ELWxxDGT repeat protein